MDIFAEDSDPSRDLPAIRKVEVSNGSPFLIERQDPFGFWQVRREHGQIPAELQGLYTRVELAETAINTYIKKMKPAAVKEKKNDDESPQAPNRNRSPREQRGGSSQ